MSDFTEFRYEPDPQRGCGRKVPGGTYLETGPLSPGGELSLWTHIFGEGVEGAYGTAYCRVPPRQMMLGDLAATLVRGEFVPAGSPFADLGSEARRDQYERLRLAVLSDEAVFDHVGRGNYTADEFHSEIFHHGASRRVGRPEFAEQIARKTPIPIVFTHSRIPVFRDERQRERVLDLLRQDVPDEQLAAGVLDTVPTWYAPRWGLSVRHERGSRHYMRPLLTWVGRIERGRRGVDDDLFDALARELARARWIEQMFGATWITRVSYVRHPDDGPEKLDKLTAKRFMILEPEEDSEQEGDKT